MAVPTGASALPSLRSAAAALAILASVSAGADAPPFELHEAIKAGLPHYDPSIREKALADQAQREARLASAQAPPSPAVAPASSAAPKAGIPPPPLGGPAVVNEKPIELPKMEVHATYPRFKPVPRIRAEKPLQDIPADPFESRAGRDARLIKKHSSKLEQIIDRIPLIGGGLLGKVREAEAREQKAKTMNEVADALEWDQALGHDPAEIKKIRDEYEKLYYSGPSSLGH
ncbi:MAG TPA: hypothetical protein VL200_07440 [Lacunisphaera sp.]|jgi:hypothetical protein|nr:hypothetical protein [Lacunisphaera sp.]